MAEPLARAPAFAPGPLGFGRAVLPPAARFVLRMGSPPRDADGFRLDGAMNSVAGDGARLAARLGPDEFLLVDYAPSEGMAERLAADLGGAFHALVDIGHRHVAFEAAGPAAADILNAGCPLDLSDAGFPAGYATRTLLGKAEIVLMRPAAEARFLLECARSFADYVRAFLIEAAGDGAPTGRP